jgi:HAD superfamily hydrolase (TIGR01509 family)
MGVLIDLDLTLIDSQFAEPLRKARQWRRVYDVIPKFTAYDGVSELMAELTDRGIPVCVVTSSPQPYCHRVLDHFKWTGIQTVCYYDTKRHKPDPAPILLGLEKLGINASQAISVGDDPKDTAAANTARVYSVGALWGALDKEALIKSGPDALCEIVGELKELILSRFSEAISV